MWENFKFALSPKPKEVSIKRRSEMNCGVQKWCNLRLLIFGGGGIIVLVFEFCSDNLRFWRSLTHVACLCNLPPCVLFLCLLKTFCVK